MKRCTLILFIALLAGCAHSRSASMSDEQQLAQREQELLIRIAQSHRGSRPRLVAHEFRCEVIRDGKAIPYPKTFEHYSLCTGVGHERRSTGPLDELFDSVTPRTGIIETMNVTRSGDAATVVSQQTYRGWMPYDGPFERHSLVTDTWVRRNGEWLLAHRVSEVMHPQS